MTMREASVLHSYQLAIRIVVRDLEPGYSFSVGVGVEAAPADDAWVEAAGVEEETACFG